MGHKSNDDRIQEAERTFLRRCWWLFPAAGLFLAMLTGGGFWEWVGMGWPVALDGSQLWSWRALGAGLAGATIPLAWVLTLKRKKCARNAMLLALGGFVAVEIVLRIPIAQTTFWLAVRSRLGVAEAVLREVAYIQIDEAAGRKGNEPAIILAGSSQMIHGVDELLLGRQLGPRLHVIRRVCSSLMPMEFLASMDYMPFRQGDICVQYLSELDFAWPEEYRVSWYRPFASWTTLPDVLQSAGMSCVGTHWRETVDYSLAATLSGWRIRDGWREIVRNFWGRMGQDNKLDRRAEGDPPLEMSTWEWKAFETSAARLEEKGVELWVFAGDVNPSIYNEGRMARRAEVCARLEKGAQEGRWKYIPAPELDAGLDVGDWKDKTHLNASGREKLTMAMARVLKSEILRRQQNGASE